MAAKHEILKSSSGGCFSTGLGCIVLLLAAFGLIALIAGLSK